jgi:hypothetical protein
MFYESVKKFDFMIYIMQNVVVKHKFLNRYLYMLQTIVETNSRIG